jgi:hypothetical protein
MHKTRPCACGLLSAADGSNAVCRDRQEPNHSPDIGSGGVEHPRNFYGEKACRSGLVTFSKGKKNVTVQIVIVTWKQAPKSRW